MTLNVFFCGHQDPCPIQSYLSEMSISAKCPMAFAKCASVTDRQTNGDHAIVTSLDSMARYKFHIVILFVITARKHVTMT